MLAWGRKMLNELHHRKLQFWYFLQQVIFYINFKVGISSSNDKSIFVFLIFFFFGVESPNKYGEKVLQFSDLMLLMHIINWENWRPFLIALEVVFMSIHGDASKSLKNNIKREKKLLTCSCPWHLSSLCLCEWCSLLIFLNYFLSLYFCFWDLSFIG